jgi:hypothetical protein
VADFRHFGSHGLVVFPPLRSGKLPKEPFGVQLLTLGSSNGWI